MAASIGLRVQGRKDSLRPRPFIEAIRYFLGIVQDIDAALSKNPKGMVDWEIETLNRSSPAVFSLRAPETLTKVDIASDIERECVKGLRLLSESGERLPSYSDAAISKTIKLARLGQSRLELIEVFTPHDKARLGMETIKNIESLIVTRYESQGSIVGSLDTIMVHNGSEFRVWEEVADRPVTCSFPKEMLPAVKDALGKRVLVFGGILANFKGQPTVVRVEGFEKYPAESDLPSIEEMSGLVQDFTGGVPLKDYIEEIRLGSYRESLTRWLSSRA